MLVKQKTNMCSQQPDTPSTGKTGKQQLSQSLSYAGVFGIYRVNLLFKTYLNILHGSINLSLHRVPTFQGSPYFVVKHEHLWKKAVNISLVYNSEFTNKCSS